MSRVTDRIDWRDVWADDKISIIKMMRKNLADDITIGHYDLLGTNIQRQILDIKDYERKFAQETEELNKMDWKSANKWCYYDLKKRGAIY